jgi:hypothetical protein
MRDVKLECHPSGPTVTVEPKEAATEPFGPRPPLRRPSARPLRHSVWPAAGASHGWLQEGYDVNGFMPTSPSLSLHAARLRCHRHNIQALRARLLVEMVPGRES